MSPPAKITPEVIAELEARYPMVGRLRGEDIDDTMAGAILRDCAISEMVECGMRRASGRDGVHWPVTASQRQVERYGYRWYRLCADAAVG